MVRKLFEILVILKTRYLQTTRKILFFLRSKAPFIYRLIKTLHDLPSQLSLKRDNVRYCHHMWKQIFVSENGDVYICCHHKPGVIGNINRSSIDKIWNSKAMMDYRKQCLDGTLPCRRNCRIVPRPYELKEEPEVRVPVSAIDTIWFLFNEHCNINCLMCPQRHLDRNMPALKFETVEKSLRLDGIREVVIQGGEPLYSRDAIKAFQYFGERGTQVKILTNGTLMNRQLAEMIVSYSSEFCVSINAGSKKMHETINKGSRFEQVLENIQFVKSVAKEWGKDLKVVLRMTIIPQNIDEIPLFIRNAKGWGADGIDFGSDLFVRKLVRSDRKLRARLKKEIDAAYQEMSGQYYRTHIDHLVNLGLAETSSAE